MVDEDDKEPAPAAPETGRAEPSPARDPGTGARRKRTALLSALFLLAAAGSLWWIYSTEPTARRTGATKESAMLVEVVEARKGTFRPVIEVLGTVEAAREVVLRPRVGGEIDHIAESFQPGEAVGAGEVLAGIDRADYENALVRRKSELREAEANLAIERGRQTVAREDLERIEGPVPEEQKALVLRRPQLKTAEARVEAARAAVALAELNLGRTRVKAPFEAEVLEREVDLGSQVDPGDELGRLVGVETHWVIATVPVSRLPQISFAEEDPESPGATAKITNPGTWPANAFREGRVEALIGGLTDRTRLARVRIAVDDPLGRETDGETVPRLLLGSVLRVRIEGRVIEDVVRVDRDYLRGNGTVWLMDEGVLRIRPVEIAFRDSRYAYVAGGLETGDRIVTTSLATIADGVPLRLAEGEEDADGGGRE